MDAREKVAEALCRFDTRRDADEDITDIMDYEDGDFYRAQADAAISALDRETRTLADGEGGMSTNWRTGETTIHSKPCTRQSRLVGPWETQP